MPYVISQTHSASYPQRQLPARKIPAFISQPVQVVAEIEGPRRKGLDKNCHLPKQDLGSLEGWSGTISVTSSSMHFGFYSSKLCSSLNLSLLRRKSFSRRAIFNDSLCGKDFLRHCGFAHQDFAVTFFLVFYEGILLPRSTIFS